MIMSKLTEEQYNELPEFLKNDYVKDGDGYSHAGLLKVKNTANELDKQAKLTAAELEEYREKEAEKIAEAERKAYEKAKAEGNTEEMEIRLNQKIADAEKRATETENQFKERMKKLAEKQKSALAAKLASKYAKKGGTDAYEILVSRYIDIDPETDEVTILDDNGGATSLKLAEFEAGLKNNALLMPLTRADIVTENGGNVNGSNDKGGAHKKPSEMTSQERIEFKQRDPEGFRRAFNL